MPANSYFPPKKRLTHVCNENNKMYISEKKMRYTTFLAFVAVLTLAILSSCTTTKVVEHEVIKHDSIYITAVSVDTILRHDSIHIRERGDTIEKMVYQYIYKVKERTDTMFIERTDTITKTETKVEEKTKYRKDWLSIIGAIVVGAVVGIIIRSVKQ